MICRGGVICNLLVGDPTFHNKETDLGAELEGQKVSIGHSPEHEQSIFAQATSTYLLTSISERSIRSILSQQARWIRRWRT